MQALLGPPTYLQDVFLTYGPHVHRFAEQEIPWRGSRLIELAKSARSDDGRGINTYQYDGPIFLA